MPIIVTVSVGSTRARIEVTDLQKDGLLPQNIVLVGCKELAMDGMEEKDQVNVHIWSVPASSVEGYIIGELAPPVAEPTPEDAPPPVGLVDPLAGLTDEQRVAVRERQSELRELDRQRTAELRARKEAAAKTPPVESEPETPVAVVPEPKRRGRRRKGETTT